MGWRFRGRVIGSGAFAARLRVFFVLLVIVPMIALAVVLFTLTARSETGKADAAIASGVRTAFALYEESRRRRDAGGPRSLATDPQLSAALSSGVGIEARLRQLHRRPSARLGDRAARAGDQRRGRPRRRDALGWRRRPPR